MNEKEFFDFLIELEIFLDGLDYERDCLKNVFDQVNKVISQ